MSLNNIFLFFPYKIFSRNKFLFKIYRKLFRIALDFYLEITSLITFKYLRNKNKGSKQKLIYIHTQAWGEYLDWFLDYNLPSLLQDGNIPKLASEGFEIHLNIYTSMQGEKKLAENNRAKRILKEFSNYGVFHIKSFIIEDFVERNDIQIKNLLNFIKECLRNKAYFLHSPPDIIFGDYSIYNAFKCIENKDSCFSAPTARVSLHKTKANKHIKELSENNANISNPRLVSCLFDSLIPDMEFAFDKKDSNTTFDSGVSMRKINSNSFAVIHNIPSVFLGTFKKIDLLFFHTYNGFNDWDRKWSSILLRSNRLKVSGSSDLFFLIEITKDYPSKEDAPFRKGMLNNDLKNEGLKLEHLIPNQFISFWKKE